MTGRETDIQFDAIVVGMGPVGACMALALAREGLDVAVVESLHQPFDKPRAIGIDHDSLRLLQGFGLMDQVAPTLGDYRPSEYRSASGELLRRIIPQPAPFPQGWPPYSTFVQPALEQILRGACRQQPRIQLKLGWMASAPDQSGDRIELPIANADTGETQILTASYLIGCDGARSPVRESLPVTLHDLAFDERWLVVDVLVDDQAELPDVTVQYCNARRPATFIAGPGSLRRWEIMLLPDDDSAAMEQEESVWRLLAPYLDKSHGQLWRAASYRFHALVADSWQCGRVFLAGDAAHQTPPFMAQGLNQGIKDVANLAWKLGAVSRGSARPSILDTYTEERKPNAIAVIELTKQLGKIICELDPERAAARDRAMLDEMSAGRGEIVRQDMLPPLGPGTLVMRCERFGRGAGKTFPQPMVVSADDVHRLDDLMEYGFALFTARSIDDAVKNRAQRKGVTLLNLGSGNVMGTGRRVDSVGLDWLSQHGVAAALVRPDHIVFGTAVTESGIAPLLDQLFASLGGPVKANALD